MRAAVLTFTIVAAVAAVAAAPAFARADTVIDPAEPPGLKHADTAVALSLGGTLVSWAAIGLALDGDNDVMGYAGILGAYFAPSLGHVYADRPFTRGFAARTLGAVAAVAGSGIAVGECGWRSECDGRAGEVLMIAGAIAFGLGTLDDIVRAPHAVRLHNARIHQLALTPTLGPDGHAGLALGGQF